MATNKDKCAAALSAALNARSKALQDQEQHHRQTLMESTFHNRQNAPKAINSFRQRMIQMKDTYKREKDYLIAAIVRQACPVPISEESVSDEELIQQIAFVKDQMPGVFNESSLDYSPQSAELVVDVAIGKMQSATPNKLAQGVLSFKTGSDFNALSSGVQRSIAMNNIDVATTLGDTRPENNLYEDDTFYSSIRNSLLLSVSGNVKDAVLRRTKAEIERVRNTRLFNEDVMTEGLTAFESDRIRRQITREARKPNVMAELFTNVRVFNETVADTESENFLNEAVFQATVLEAHAVLGMVELKEEALCIALKKARSAYLKAS